MASLSEESRLRQMIATLNVQYLEDNLSMTGQKSINIITNRRAQYLHYTIYSIVTNFFSLMNDFQQGSWFIVVFIPLLSRYINKELKEKTKIGQNIKYPESLHVDFVPNLTHLNFFFFFYTKLILYEASDKVYLLHYLNVLHQYFTFENWYCNF